MPYKSEKIKLQGMQDRRRKLTDEDIEEIKKTIECSSRTPIVIHKHIER